MSTVREIAKLTGVSIATVSRVLNNHPSVREEVRDRVMAAVNSERYTAPVGKRDTSIVAYVYTGETSMASPFDTAVLEGVYDSLADSNYTLMILDTRRARRNSESYSQMFHRLGVRGVLLRTTYSSRHVCGKIVGQGYPAVVVGGKLEQPAAHSVYCESRSASQEAVSHLIEIGHRRIAVCVNLVEDFDHAERLQGYRDAYESHGLEVDEKFIIRIPASKENGAQVVRRLAAAADKPTAIFITDPMTAVGAMNEAKTTGLRVPEELSIIGFDDSDLRHMVIPTMSCVCQDAQGLGLEAGRLLNAIIEGERSPTVHPPNAWVEIHDSTGPPKIDGE